MFNIPGGRAIVIQYQNCPISFLYDAINNRDSYNPPTGYMVSEEMTVRDMTGVREMTVEMTCTVPRAKAQLRQLMSEMSKSGTLN